MKKFLTICHELHEDKEGASFIEYTVLLGVILAVSIGVVSGVGYWAAGRWALLPTAPAP